MRRAFLQQEEEQQQLIFSFKAFPCFIFAEVYWQVPHPCMQPHSPEESPLLLLFSSAAAALSLGYFMLLLAVCSLKRMASVS